MRDTNIEFIHAQRTHPLDMKYTTYKGRNYKLLVNNKTAHIPTAQQSMFMYALICTYFNSLMYIFIKFDWKFIFPNERRPEGNHVFHFTQTISFSIYTSTTQR